MAKKNANYTDQDDGNTEVAETLPGQHPNPSWGADRLAPLSTRQQLRQERRAAAKIDTFVHSDELADIRRAEREGQRGVVAQLASGSPAAGVAAGVTATPPSEPAAPAGGGTGDGTATDGTTGNGLAGNGAGAAPAAGLWTPPAGVTAAPAKQK